MMTLDTLLVATDFSDDAQHAVQRAALLAQRHRAQLRLLHVVAPAALRGPLAWFKPPRGTEPRVAAAQVQLARLAEQLAARHGVVVTASVRVGRALEEICRAADEADLLVIASRRVNPLRSWMCGTPAEQLLRLVRKPALVVQRGPTRAREAPTHYGSVLAAVDLDGDAAHLLRSAAALAPDAQLHVFHAVSSRRTERMQASDVPAEIVREVADGERQRALARLLSLLAAVGLPQAQAEVAHGDARRLTVQRQRAVAADLVLLGQDGPSALCNFLLGGVPQQVLADAACDVLLFPKLTRRDRARAAAGRHWLDASTGGAAPGARRG